MLSTKDFYKNKKSKSGVGLIEVVIAVTIVTVGIFALINSYDLYLKFALVNDRDIRANYLAEEGLEAMTFLHMSNWNTKIATLSPGTDYYLTWSSGEWVTTATPQYVDGMFLRKIRVYSVYRNATDDIVTTGGTLDPNTKKLEVILEYVRGHSTSTKTTSTYLSNLYGS